MTGSAAPAARRGRWAVAAMFLANGFVTGSWAPQIPLLLTRLDIGETTLGLLILVFGLGALVAMPASGMLMARFGSRPVLRALSVACSFGLAVVALAPGVWLAAPAMLFFGAVIGAMDVAMNTNAVAVERQLGRGIMSSSHGFWSLGGFAGGAAGGLMIEATSHLWHAFAVTAAALAVVAVAARHLVAETAITAPKRRSLALPANPAIYLVGLVALFAMIPEGAVLDWAALYLRQELDSSLTVAGFAFAAFSGTMAVMRFLGDGVRARFGAVATLRGSSLVAACGLLVAGFATNAWMAIAAFAFAGFGVANIVPIAFSAAGNQPGMASGTGMSVVTTMGYSGILVAPSAIGFVGERTGFAPIFVALAGLLVLVSLMAGLARGADFAAETRAAPAE